MTYLVAVVAIANNRVMGADQDIPWYLPEDLKHFKALTIGKPMIMGRKTYDSIGHPLPDRRNIVITHQANWQAEGVEPVLSLEEALDLIENEPEATIIGGAEIFKLAMDRLDCLQVTEIELDIAGDTYFPELEEQEWEVVSRDSHQSKTGLNYTFVVYQRRKIMLA